ncbi:heavy metal translocating P-type ATPase [Pseudomarimonas salicorniae]|uniref:Cadmium-translocating P-type ATPase n=1 Tax=Pseudomarimonas salicorniae TaxID=2933270 RepID=A0ABT0GDY7_9GAMM|nr:heavy metal translocating P-type ATPase [Lysobacter sp. CAU 1642]MCK7592761.1 cadmium-translocating P-type ATPase [Lysobacter sp. CAU 1642]
MAEPRMAGCHHCGEPLPARPERLTLDGEPRDFCCAGCAAAARFIRDAGLADYYRLRSQPAGRSRAESLALWDREDILAEHCRTVDGSPGLREITVVSDDMRCAACAWLIDRALQREPGVEQVGVNAVTGRIRLRWHPEEIALSRLLERLAELGYRVHLAPDPAREDARRREQRSLMIRLGVAALGAMQAMMLAEALYLDFDRAMDPATRDFFRWITLLVSTPVVFYSGWPFIAGMLRELRARHAGMDSLIASSVLLAWAASAIETVRGGPDVWFDAAVMFVFFLLAARALERFARQRSQAVVERLARAQPGSATRLDADGGVECVPLAGLNPNDVLQVSAGEALPADGVLLEPGDFDEALVSGESRPVARAAGEEVLAGSQCLGRPVRLRVTRVGSDTRLSRLVQTIERAQEHRPPLARWAERLAHHFVLVLFVAAALTALVWWWLDPSRAFAVTLAVLVVSCPCALSLAVPAGIAAAQSGLSRSGVLSLTPDALERLASVDCVVLDKTGTLTAGAPTLLRCEAFGELTRDQVRRLAAALERASGHPLARAFEHVGLVPEASDVAVHAGLGVSGRVQGQSLRLGRADFACSGEDDGALWLGDDEGRALGRFEVRDALREDALEAIGQLRRLGVALHIASGDGEQAVREVAEAVGVEAWTARQFPEDKLARVRALQAKGYRVAMIGDGINDAPVLAGADISFALSDGSSIAHRAADLVVLQGALTRIPQTLALARRARRVLRQNLAWALAYNVVALPFAMAGWVAPWLAALGMTASSLGVTLNALRLQRVTSHRSTHSGTRPVADAPRAPVDADTAVALDRTPLAGRV